MRVNIYAEEMPETPRLEIIEKHIDGHKFTGLRIYLELPASYYVGSPGRANAGEIIPARAADHGQPFQLQAPFIHRPGDDDSAAVTFWGKRDLRVTLRAALALLDQHYGTRGDPTAQEKA
jgi:hypothetical protein